MTDLPPRPLNLRDLKGLGLSGSKVRYLVAEGRLRRVVRGVYCPADLPDSLELRAQCLAMVLPARAVVCDRTAAWLWGIDCLEPGEQCGGPPRVEVVALGGHDRTRRREALGGKRDLVEAEICTVAGVRVTTPVRTACDLASLRGRYPALAVYDAFARQFGLTPVDYARQLQRFVGRRGVKQARELATYAVGLAESPGESWTRLAIIDAGLPPPEPQVWVTMPDGHRFRLDLAYPQLRIAVEYDGEEFHTSADHRAADDARRRSLISLGWHVIVVRKGQFTGAGLDSWLPPLREEIARRTTTYARVYARGEAWTPGRR